MENYNHIDGSEVDPSYWIRFGPDVVPLPKLSAQQTQGIFNQQLNPTMYMTVDSQGITDALLLMRNPVGCEVPTGTNFAIAIPALTSVMTDIYGIPIPGAPQSGSQFVVNYTSDGNPVGQYALSSSPGTSKKLPFVTDFYVGEALGRKEYGTYDWTDGGGVLHKAKGITDPTVTKPEINVLYNPNQFYVDETTNELNISLDGASGVLAGLNIMVTPGVGPTVAPTITMASSGVLTDGPYRWAYSWRVKQPDGTYTSTALSPTSFGKAGGGYNSATVEGPANTRADVDGIYVWRNLNSDAASFYLVTTITSGVNSPWSYDDNTSDGSLLSNTLFTASEPTISTTTTMLLTGDPANASSTPMGTITLGPWGLRDTVAGYTYDGLQSGAHLLFALDENHKEDSIAWFFRKADGTFPLDGSAGLLSVDYDNPPVTGDWPASLSLWMNGYGQFDSGVVTVVLDHSPPVDADVAVPTDGMIALCSNDNTAWVRLTGTWHQIGGGSSGTDGCTLTGFSGGDYTLAGSGSSGSSAVISWTGDEFDDAGYWNGAHPTRLTAPVTGTYLVTAQVAWAVALASASYSADVYQRLKINGSLPAVPHRTFASIACVNTLSTTATTFGNPGNPSQTVPLSRVMQLTAGDYIELQVLVAWMPDSTNAWANANSSWFSIQRIA